MAQHAASKEWLEAEGAADLGNDDAALAARAASGDRDAFATLVARHYDFMFRVAYRWCGHRADAEDIAQDVCVRLGKAIRGFRGGSAFTSWLYAVIVNAAKDRGRRLARETARVDAYAAEAPDHEPAAPGVPENLAEQLWAAVRRLPDKQREAVALVYGEGASHARAAELMGCAENTVSWHVHEAKKRLKQMMRDADEEA